MNKLFYPRLALQNIQKNARSYISYMITCIITIAMFYIMSALAYAAELDQFYGLHELRLFLGYGQWIIGIFAFIFLFYTHSFIIKRRKKEFGLYNILGMEKRHIMVVLFLETLYTSIISIFLGIFSGIILYRAAQLFLIKLIHAQGYAGSPLSANAFRSSLILFCILFLLTFLSTLKQIHVANPVELLRGGQVGEKEPKARIILVILGLASLGTGYYISITATSPMQTIGLFFVAVILVIIGTYFLFTSITIAVLKLLKKNKRYYYKPTHFTFISGMLYRMKQNAVGLANICILSTMVLVMMSTSLLLYVSIEDLIRQAYPRNIEISLLRPDTDEIESIEQHIDSVLQEKNILPENLQRFYESSLITVRDGNTFYCSDDASIYTDTNMVILTFMTLDDFNRIAGTQYIIDNPMDVYLYTYSGTIDDNSITVNNTVLNIKGFTTDAEIADGPSKDMADTFYVIVKDMDTLNTLISPLINNIVPSYTYTFDIDADSETIINISNDLQTALFESETSALSGDGHITNSSEASVSYYELYGGLLFIGTFLGVLFLMATVLIIYYKQITEGYEDQHRFEIMQNVGMSRKEVKNTIKSQVLSVFYLPLGLACVHTAFAFPIVSRLLSLLQMTNTTLFLVGMSATIAVFAVFYTIIYVLTAQIYYKIVSSKSVNHKY